MKTPPFLMAAALLFWGWENGLLLWGALLAAALEGSRLTRTRWEFTNADLNRVWMLSAGLFLGAFLILYSTQDRMVFVFKLAQWLPFCFSPMMLAQTYGNRTSMPLSVFWWLLRRSPNSPTARKSYNISYCYFALCLLAASSSTEPNRFFYPGVALLIVLALTAGRPRRVSSTTWVILLTASITGGFFGQKQLQRMQNAMEGVLGTWIANFFHSSLDTRECRTKIGFMGDIPLSGKIVMRVRPEPGGFVPGLLREAIWDAYKKTAWSASNVDFSQTRSGVNDSIRLMPSNALSSEIEISRFYDNGEGLLALPHGTFEINDLPGMVQTNRLGVTSFTDGPGLLDFRASFGPGPTFDCAPGPRDLVVPEDEKPALDEVVSNLNLMAMTDRQKVRALERYFSQHFTYSLSFPRHRDRTNQTPLAFFLNRSHSGHCEYFATATVLLLREAGVPSRYATGYVVPESARHGDTYFVRERHAHAWALAWHGDTGLWEQVDTTPSDREKAEEAQPSWWEPASDALSNLYYQFSKWRWSRTSYARFSSWLLAPVILYLVGRILLSRQRQKTGHGGDDANSPRWPGLDSELFLINRQLAAVQLSRRPNEPLQSWQQRLEEAFPDSERLRRIFLLHRSLRFDPRGLEQKERETLRAESQQWLAEFTAGQRPAPG